MPAIAYQFVDPIQYARASEDTIHKALEQARENPSDPLHREVAAQSLESVGRQREADRLRDEEGHHLIQNGRVYAARPRWRDIVFMQNGGDSEEPLRILDELGPEAAANYLSQWENGEGEVRNEPSAGSADYTEEVPHPSGNGVYEITHNPRLGYIGMEHRFLEPIEDTEEQPADNEPEGPEQYARGRAEDESRILRAIPVSTLRGLTWQRNHDPMSRAVAAEYLESLGRNHEADLLRDPEHPVYRDEGGIHSVVGLAHQLEQARPFRWRGVNHPLSNADLSHLHTALWLSIGEPRDEEGNFIDPDTADLHGIEGAPLDEHYSYSDIHPSTMASMIADWREFLHDNRHMIPPESEEHAAHDFWLSRNGHGAGFFDDYGEHYPGEDVRSNGRTLQDAARQYGEFYLGEGNMGPDEHGEETPSFVTGDNYIPNERTVNRNENWSYTPPEPTEPDEPEPPSPPTPRRPRRHARAKPSPEWLRDTEEKLIANIVANPSDPLPRHVYAEFLEHDLGRKTAAEYMRQVNSEMQGGMSHRVWTIGHNSEHDLMDPPSLSINVQDRLRVGHLSPHPNKELMSLKGLGDRTNDLIGMKFGGRYVSHWFPRESTIAICRTAKDEGFPISADPEMPIHLLQEEPVQQTEEQPIQHAAYRAPAGGAIVRGTYYTGGKLIPDLEGEFANPPK